MILGFTIGAAALTTGALTGLAYGVLAVGLLLVYRATGIVNFAHGQIGALAAAILGKIVVDQGVPFFVALPIALAVGALVGVAAEAGIVRRLSRSPRVVVLVATIGLSEVLLVAQSALPEVERVSAFPTPLQRSLDLGVVVLRPDQLLALALLPAAVVGLALLLSRTPTGLAIRAVADNRDAAELAGISSRRVAMVVWGSAGALAALTAILIAPLRGEQVGRLDATAIGAGLLLRALAAGLVGRLTSLPLALAGGVGVGVVEAVLLFNGVQPGFVELVLFVVVLLLVLVRGSEVGDTDAVALVAPSRPVPSALRSTWWAPRLGAMTWAVVGVVALALPFVVTTSSAQFRITAMLCYALIGLSVVVLTGWAGQLSLGQFAVAGLGAFTAAALTSRGVPFWAAVPEAAVAGVLTALLIGLPALRVRGLFLSVTTLAFAVAARESILTSSFLSGRQGDATITRGTVFGFDLTDDRTYYWVCLVVVAACAAAIGHARRTGLARSIIAVRENERRAASLTLSPATTRLIAFGISGALAATGGALYGGLATTFGPQGFRVEESLRVVSLVIIGGTGSVAGAVLGAIYLLGVPALFGDSAVSVLLTSGLGLLVLLLYLPGGLASLVALGRGALLERLARGREEPAAEPDAATVARRVPAAPAVDGVAIEARGVTVAFGGAPVVDAVDLVLATDEVLGLIGANGAGKSTLLNAISGFVPTSGGSIHLLGSDVTTLPAHDRARLGLGRVFQDARLFGELTVREAVLVALEAHGRSEVVPSLLGLRPSRTVERTRRAEAEAVIGEVGLGRFVDTPVLLLSTGTRRIVELACLLAQRPRVLLLDEPTAGLAQREAEAFAPLLLRVRAELSAPLVVVEHDLPFVLSISDRVQCLDRGRTISVGTPTAVRSDPAVIAAYLGTDDAAIGRSGHARGPTPPGCAR